jgi:hypothetical protein
MFNRLIGANYYCLYIYMPIRTKWCVPGFRFSYTFPIYIGTCTYFFFACLHLGGSDATATQRAQCADLANTAWMRKSPLQFISIRRLTMTRCKLWAPSKFMHFTLRSHSLCPRKLSRNLCNSPLPLIYIRRLTKETLQDLGAK